jgi:hypothetical protein
MRTIIYVIVSTCGVPNSVASGALTPELSERSVADAHGSKMIVKVAPNVFEVAAVERLSAQTDDDVPRVGATGHVVAAKLRTMLFVGHSRGHNGFRSAVGFARRYFSHRGHVASSQSPRP